MRILLISLNGARADHISCYDYVRATTPAIDALAAGATIFTDCHVSDLPAVAATEALFAAGAGQTAADEEDKEEVHWVAQLRAHNWETIFCAPDTPASGPGGSSWGFKETIYPAASPSSSLPTAEQIASRLVEHLQSLGQRDQWLLYVQFNEPALSTPIPAVFQEQFGEQALPEYPDAELLQEDVRAAAGPDSAAALLPEPRSDAWAAYQARMDAYDGALSYVDEQVGRIVETLEKLQLLEETVVIITSNHGMAIGDMGMYFAANNAAEAVTRVPLIMRWPGSSDSGWFYDGLLYQYDVGPTILEMLGIPLAVTPALSHAAAVRGDPLQARKFLLLNINGPCRQRVIRTDRYRLIETLEAGPYAYAPRYLFDVRRDPQQSENVAVEEEAVVAELLQQYGR